MRRQVSVKRAGQYLYQRGKAVYATLFMCLVSVQMAQADGVIPISNDDKTAADSDFAMEMVKIFQKDIIPFIQIAGGVWIIWTAISTMAGGVKEAQERQKFEPLKNAIIKVTIVVVVGGALLYLLDLIRTKTFTMSFKITQHDAKG